MNYPAWRLSAKDFPQEESLTEQIRFVCCYGILAASLHNTQPWSLILNKDLLTVAIDESRVLKDGDPSLRETYISMGCLIQNIESAGIALGLSLNTDIQTSGYDKVATIRFTSKSSRESIDEATLESIVSRVTNRTVYDKKPLDPAQVGKIKNARSSASASITVEENPQNISLIANLTGTAISMAMSNPTFRGELAKLIRFDWEKATDGMPGFTMHPNPIISKIEPLKIKYAPIVKTQGRKERRMVESASAIVCISTPGDTPKYWIEAGRSYQAAANMATRLGLASATNAATVEALDFHEDIEQALNLPGRLQAVLRVGHSKHHPKHSPRRPIDQVLTVK